MKRFVAITAAVLLIAALFVGCGGSDPTGKYVVKTIGGQSLEDALSESGFSVEDYLDLLGIESLEEFMTVELKSDGKAILGMSGEEDEIGTWKQDGNDVTITFDDEPLTFKLNGNELSVEMEGEQYVFVKK